MSFNRELCLASFVVLAAMGCGGDGFSTAENVGGTVTLNGEPLPKATILFQPIGPGNAGPQSSGMTDDSGRFILTFADGKKGAVVGKHRVIITTRRVAPKADNPDQEEEIEPDVVPTLYRTEPPTFEVPKGGTENAKIELNGPKPGKPGDPPERND